jgi:hypothetical protein
MSYSNEIAPNTNDNMKNHSAVAYTNNTANGGIVSIANRYPIAKITQPQAINACKYI